MDAVPEAVVVDELPEGYIECLRKSSCAGETTMRLRTIVKRGKTKGRESLRSIGLPVLVAKTKCSQCQRSDKDARTARVAEEREQEIVAAATLATPTKVKKSIKQAIAVEEFLSDSFKPVQPRQTRFKAFAEEVPDEDLPSSSSRDSASSDTEDDFGPYLCTFSLFADRII